MQGGLEQAMQHRSGLRARSLPGITDLSLNLRLSQNHGVEPRRYAVQMAHRLAIARNVSVLARPGGWICREPLAEQRPDDIEGGLVVGDQVELGAIARREQHAA